MGSNLPEASQNVGTINDDRYKDMLEAPWDVQS
jgi:hypothetical protein